MTDSIIDSLGLWTPVLGAWHPPLDLLNSAEEERE